MPTPDKNTNKQDKNQNCNKKAVDKKLSPYQKFLQGKDPKYNKYKQSYFEFYDDVKDKTHKIIDWWHWLSTQMRRCNAYIYNLY